MAKSSSKTASRKTGNGRPPKPYKDFPLGPHASGAWQKKIRGKLYYFGRWARQVDGKLERLPGDDWWKPALDLYNAQKDDIYAGRVPKAKRHGALQLRDLCNEFLGVKLEMLKTGEIVQQTYIRHKGTTDLIIGQFGRDALVEDLTVEDFAALRAVMAKRWGPVRLGIEIINVKSVFKYGHENDLLENTVRFGTVFRGPSATVLRKHKAKKGKRILDVEQCHQVLDLASVSMRAMILLGLNCGYGNHDCATLPMDALDLDGGWVEYPRPKTGVERRCPLWPETIEAIKAAVAQQPTPHSPETKGLVFITKWGNSWLHKGLSGPVTMMAIELLKAAGVHRKGLGFYTFRHVFRTVADGCRDQVAINSIMGHVDGSMAGVYRESIEDERLQAVVAHVHAWLWPVEEGGSNNE